MFHGFFLLVFSVPPKLSIFRFCFRRNFHAWLGEASKKSREILRQLLNHVICLLKAHFASLCVTSAPTYVEAERGQIGWRKQMPQLQGRKTFSHLTCCKTRASLPRTHRFGKLFSIKKMRRQRRIENKANASGKTHRKVRSINNGIRKESFVSWIQISLPKSFHWSTNVLFAFFSFIFHSENIFAFKPRGETKKCLFESFR